MAENDGRVTLRRLPTACFTLTKEQIDWLREKAIRENTKQSYIVRDLITAAQQEEERRVA